MTANTWSRTAGRALAALWIVLGLMKLASADPGAALARWLSSDLARWLSYGIIGLELLLGLALAGGAAAHRRLAGIVSILMLSVFGAHALLDAPVRCSCAGRAADLTPIQHSILVSVMLLLAAASLREHSSAPARVPWRRLALVTGLLSVIAVGTVLVRSPQRATLIQDITPDRVTSTPVLQGLDAARVPDATRVEPGEASPGALALRGVVRDPTGRSLAGVVLWTAVASGSFFEEARATVARSDAEGAFALPLPMSPADQWILARGDSYLPYGRALAPPYDGVVVVLERGRCVRGSVVDERGTAIEGAAIEAWGVLGEDVGGRPGVLFGGGTLPEFARCASDARGEFELCGLPAGPVRVFARRSGYYSPYVGAPVLVGPGEAPPIAFVLSTISVLRARAIDKGSGQALASASYELVMPPGSGWVASNDSATRYPLLRRVGSGLLNAESVYAEFRRSGEAGGTMQAMTLIVSSAGYARRVVEVPLRPFAEAGLVLPIELERATAEPLVPVQFRARWPGGEGFTGSLLVRIGARDTNPPRWATPYIPMRFVRGECEGAVELPPGPFFARARGHEGSTVAWSAATTRSTFDVVSGSTGQAAVIELEGGRLLVDARTEDGVALRDFTLSITGPGAGMTLSTWLSAVPYTTPLDDGGPADLPGLYFYLDPGSTSLVLKKTGFEPVEATVAIEPGGRATTWSPRLHRK